MITWKLTLEYDGSRYSGWQEQKNAPRTVQGELRNAAEAFFGCRVEIQGAGRTDAGVHAAAQVAHLRAPGMRDTTPAVIARELNERLPFDIVVLAVERAAGKFHARHDALSRTYVYQISGRKSAFSKKYVWWIKDPLDVELMRQAASLLPGRHDFVCFRAHDAARPGESTIVEVERAEVERDDDMILFRIEASHFLWRMVRRLAGVLVKVGLHQVSIEEFRKLLGGKSDPALDVAAWTAPASGLFLESVRYPKAP